jgi:L-ascorbate metabolism protein UlaG (beta-lactamase superfamily)
MPLPDGATLTWFGHATFLLETPGGKRVLFDPWFDNPKCPDDLMDPGDVDVVLLSHGHADHIGSAVPICKQKLPAAVVAINELANYLAGKGVDGTVGMNKGGTIEVEGLKVTLVNAEHSSSFVEDDGVPIYLGDPCGLVVELEDGYRIYFAGDTAVFSDMALIGELYRPDLAILPIGDHYTMGPREARKAIELLAVKEVVPMHFGTFPLLTGTPEALRAECSGIEELRLMEPTVGAPVR